MRRIKFPLPNFSDQGPVGFLGNVRLLLGISATKPNMVIAVVYASASFATSLNLCS